MEFEELKVAELREAARHFIPEARGAGGIAHVGSKEELIDLLRGKGIMACEAKEYCDGNVKVEAPKDVPVIPVGGAVTPEKGEGSDKDPEAVAAAEAAKDGGQPKIEELQELPLQPTPQPSPEKPEMPIPPGLEGLFELDLIRKIITKNVKQDVDAEAVGKIVDEKLIAFREKFKKDTVKVIEIKQGKGIPNLPVGLCHKLTPQIAQVANLGIHQMLVGPAGGGKTTCCEKVAEILKLQFYPMSVGPQTTKSDLLGFIDAGGNYHTTPLRDAFEKGGLLLLDEVDAANAGVLTIINSLLANGYCSFPDGVKKRHDDFRCICACNTYGRGADRQYVGRNQLDAATLDRFAVVDFDYDEGLERAIAGNNTWVEKVQLYRKRANDLKMRVVISPRASIFGAKLLASGMKEELVEELVLWKGVAAEIRSKITANC